MKTKIKITKRFFNSIPNELKSWVGNSKLKTFFEKFENQTIIFTKKGLTKFAVESDFEDIGCGKSSAILGSILYVYLKIFVSNKAAVEYDSKYYWGDCTIDFLITEFFILIEKSNKKKV